ncbi:MalY/PatB family protein [Atopobium fossor]|uniref:MalY/PatB family protein n=1 Tax=Atopobium fossor TaxID=39487 RepID=UPI00040FAD57|nr:aminotransferase class I/II-fold pyridoxal phosphate-dependent enzyme [Atopobium fossor]
MQQDMSPYDFDALVDRRGSYSTQWDYREDRFGTNDVVPFSISDSDFEVPAPIIKALQQRLAHPVFGYTRWNHNDFKQPIVQWFNRRGGATIDQDWIVYSPSVIYSVATLIRMFSRPGDAVVTFTPMYDGFYGAIQANNREILPVYMPAAHDDYAFNLNELRLACEKPQAKLLLLTNPHNPTGKVFSRQELTDIVEVAQQTNTFIISDDIHRDIILGETPYTPITEIATTGVALACSSSKTFNTAGLIGSYVCIPEESVRNEFLVELKQRNALSSASIMGMYAQMAAYTRCDYYADGLAEHTRLNMQLIKDFLDCNIKQIAFDIPQGTYLAWMNISGLGVSSQQLQQACVKYGRVGIMSGATYGDDRFMRMCIACPKSKVELGLMGLLKGVQSL